MGCFRRKYYRRHCSTELTEGPKKWCLPQIIMVWRRLLPSAFIIVLASSSWALTLTLTAFFEIFLTIGPSWRTRCWERQCWGRPGHQSGDRVSFRHDLGLIIIPGMTMILVMISCSSSSPWISRKRKGGLSSLGNMTLVRSTTLGKHLDTTWSSFCKADQEWLFFSGEFILSIFISPAGALVAIKV